MKIKNTISKLLTNKWVLNIVAIIALFNVIGFMIVGNVTNVMFFVLLGILVRFFSKNMIIVLGIPIIIVNLFSFKQMREGLTTSNKSKDGFDTSTTADSSTTNTDASPTPASPASNDVTDSTESSDDTSPATFNNISSTTNKKIKASNETEQFEVGRDKRKSKIDYASTIEDAYDDLNKILGGDGIKGLTQDTQKLMQQQMDLAKSMEAMTPLIKNMMPVAEQAQSLLKNMDKNGGGLGNIMELAKKFTGKFNSQ
jgi:uncharacterized protein (DUF2147 family)